MPESPKKEREGNKESLQRKSRRKHVRVSGCKKAHEEDMQSLDYTQVWSNLKWKRRLGDEEPAHKMIGRNESR